MGSSNSTSSHPIVTKPVGITPTSNQQGENKPANPISSEEKPKLKPCCACPETKAIRDECIVLNGEEECGPLIEAHKKCMRAAGFNV